MATRDRVQGGMLSKALIALLPPLLLLLRSADAQTAGCDSEAELLSSLLWLRANCPDETYGDRHTLVPESITAAGCADAARRVAGECGQLLSSSPWFDSRKAALDRALATAACMPEFFAPAAYAIADPATTVIHTCGATVVDGFGGDFPSPIGMSHLLIDVGPQRGKVRLQFDDSTTLDAKANDNIRVYADTEQLDEVRAVFSGDLPLLAPISMPGSVAALTLVSDGTFSVSDI